MNTSLIDHGEYIEILLTAPERLNAIGPQMAGELFQKITEIASKPQVPALLLRPVAQEINGRKIAIAGGDLKELAGLDRYHAGKYCRQMSQVCEFLERAPFPTIFVADGALIGGGAELALACDIRLGTLQTFWDFKQMHIGLATGYGSAERMVRLLGKARVQSLLFTDPLMTPEEAKNCGLLHRLCQDEQELNATTPSLIQQYRSYGADAWNAQKKMLNKILEKKADPVIERENNIFTQIWKNPVHQSMLRKFMGKK